MTDKDLVILCPLNPKADGVMISWGQVKITEESIKSYWALVGNTFIGSPYVVTIGDGVDCWNSVWLNRAIDTIRCVWVIAHGLENGNILYSNVDGHIMQITPKDIYCSLGCCNRPASKSTSLALLTECMKQSL